MKFIAECGLNHNGNLDLTYELVRQSSFSGADIVKFQLGWRGGKDEIPPEVNRCVDEQRVYVSLGKMDLLHLLSISSDFNSLLLKSRFLIISLFHYHHIHTHFGRREKQIGGVVSNPEITLICSLIIRRKAHRTPPTP